MKVKVEITEILQKTIEVAATTYEEALLIIKNKYKNEEIVLDDSNHIDTEFKVVLIWTN